MKPLAAGLTLVNVATIAGLILGIIGSGLDEGLASLAFFFGLVAAIFAWIQTSRYSPAKVPMSNPPVETKPLSKRARRRLGLPQEQVVNQPLRSYRHLWTWAVGVVFLIFAVRSFCWILYIEGAKLRIQSPNNLGDLGLHITYIKYFANGVPLWPDNPIFVFSRLRYPAGIDLFNALLLLDHVSLIRGLVWVGLLASAATFYAFYRWAGAFGVGGFLFNGGLAGFAFFATHEFIDYQADKIAWKSIPLTMFVTQRGLLYAIPAGLLLLIHWRRKFYPDSEAAPANSESGGILPFWAELSLYASMPLFHVHTFLALSGLLAFWLVIGPQRVRKQVALLLALAVLPATWLVWLITDHFQAGSIISWAPGWLQSEPAFATPFEFWIYNFGLTLPGVLVLVGLVVWQTWNQLETRSWGFSDSFAFVIPALLILIFALLVKTAPWSWDNTKILIWSYFIFLPFLWRDLIARWPFPVRYAICFLLFFSGFVSLFGGLTAGGYELADRFELNSVGEVVKDLPISERFASFPTYNHPLLLNGRKVVLGYPGHLWTQGFSNYGVVEAQLRNLMMGSPDWLRRAHDLRARYLFWGDEEIRGYPGSTQPWRGRAPVVVSGFWGTIYDLQPLMPIGQ